MIQSVKHAAESRVGQESCLQAGSEEEGERETARDVMDDRTLWSED